MYRLIPSVFFLLLLGVGCSGDSYDSAPPVENPYLETARAQTQASMAFVGDYLRSTGKNQRGPETVIEALAAFSSTVLGADHERMRGAIAESMGEIRSVRDGSLTAEHRRLIDLMKLKIAARGSLEAIDQVRSEIDAEASTTLQGEELQVMLAVTAGIQGGVEYATDSANLSTLLLIGNALNSQAGKTGRVRGVGVGRQGIRASQSIIRRVQDAGGSSPTEDPGDFEYNLLDNMHDRAVDLLTGAAAGAITAEMVGGVAIIGVSGFAVLTGAGVVLVGGLLIYLDYASDVRSYNTELDTYCQFLWIEYQASLENTDPIQYDWTKCTDDGKAREGAYADFL
jgi:hypothetical protein